MMGMLWPVFIALVTVREGLRWGMLAAAASLLLTILFATPMTGAFFVLSFAPTGLVLGVLFRRRTDTVRALVGGALASLAGKAAAAGMTLLLFGLNPFAMDISMANETMDETLAMYRSLGMSEAQLEETRAGGASSVSEINPGSRTHDPALTAGVGEAGESRDEEWTMPESQMPGIGMASPSISLSRPAMILSSVDLPAPLVPSTPILAPGKKLREISFRIWRLGGTVLLTRFIVYTYWAM